MLADLINNAARREVSVLIKRSKGYSRLFEPGPPNKVIRPVVHVKENVLYCTFLSDFKLSM
jgi:hypothetical protein